MEHPSGSPRLTRFLVHPTGGVQRALPPEVMGHVQRVFRDGRMLLLLPPGAEQGLQVLLLQHGFELEEDVQHHPLRERKG